MHVSVHYVAYKWRYALFVMLILNKYDVEIVKIGPVVLHSLLFYPILEILCFAMG